jgi:hypothetical protein
MPRSNSIESVRASPQLLCISIHLVIPTRANPGFKDGTKMATKAATVGTR